MDKKKKEIFEVAGKLFLSRGPRAVGMDDLANELGMSKKTLYQYVSDKKALVDEVISQRLDLEAAFFKELETKNIDALAENVAITEFVFSGMGEMSPIFFFDLQKYFRETWKRVVNYRTSVVDGCLVQNLLKGQKEGVYRQNIDPKVMSLFFMGLLDQIFYSERLHEFQMAPIQMLKEMNRYHLMAISSPLGRKQIEILIENNKL